MVDCGQNICVRGAILVASHTFCHCCMHSHFYSMSSCSHPNASFWPWINAIFDLVLPRLRLMLFKKGWIMMPRKLAKTVRIFVEIKHIKNRRVTFYPKRIGQLFPMLWSGHEFGHKISQILWPLHSVGNSCLILSGQNITPGLSHVLSPQIYSRY